MRINFSPFSSDVGRHNRPNVEMVPVVQNPTYEEQGAFQHTLMQGYNNPQPPPLPPPRPQAANSATYQQPQKWIGFIPPTVKGTTFENPHGKMEGNAYENARGKMEENAYENPHDIFPAPNAAYDAPGKVFFDFDAK